jgi:hypothetical protein
MEETKCYCGHTTYCDCGPEIDGFKHEVKVIPKEEILANRSNAYEFIDMETLEEVAEKTYKKLYEGEPLTQDVPIDAFKQGAKWQQERSYSEKEVLDIIYKFKQTCPYFIEAWFEQFKKK